jgi:glycerophosphoryl diester phosphodiesterase
MKILLSAVIFLLSISFAAAQYPPVPVLPNVAHRGASAAAPENTLAAFRKAAQFGADGAECDVYKTADGVLVILHDKNTKRTTGFDGDITKMSYAEVQKLDAGKGEKIPALAEYLSVLKGTKTKPVIEIKQEGIVREVIDEINGSGMRKAAVIISFSAESVKTARRLAPNIPAALLCSADLKKTGGSAEDNAEKFFAGLTASAKSCNTNILDINHQILSKPLAEQLNRSGIALWAWTVDDPQRMETLLDWGVVSITTNKPDVLTKVLQRRAAQKHSAQKHSAQQHSAQKRAAEAAAQ